MGKQDTLHNISCYLKKLQKNTIVQIALLRYIQTAKTASDIRNARRSLLKVAIARDITRRRAQNDGHDRHSNHAHPQPPVWLVSDQSGKRVQRTGWKALLTSETAMQLRAARPMCGSGTLVKRSPIAGSSLIARSLFLLYRLGSTDRSASECYAMWHSRRSWTRASPP